MHAIANAVNASSAATLRAKCHTSAAHQVVMPFAAITTHANAMRESCNAALLTFHGTIHIECVQNTSEQCVQNTSEHCAAIKAHGTIMSLDETLQL